MRYLLSQIGGIDLCVTEFVRVTDHVLPRKVFLRYSPELDSPELALSKSKHKNSLPTSLQTFPCASVPTRVQLLGSNPIAIGENARKAAKLGAPGIDLNFGCPAKTVNKNRGGACLLNEPETLYAIVKAARDEVPNHIPVTAKIRLGYEARDSYIENAQAIAAAGANELIVHARSKTDGYHPPAYWECIAEIKQAINIPVIANGEIWSVADYHRCRKVSQCDDVMIGRGLLANPDLALAIKSELNGQQYRWKSWAEIADLLMTFFLLTSQAYPKKYMGNRVKQWLFYLQRQYPQALQLFQAIKKHRDFAAIYAALYGQCSASHRQTLPQHPERLPSEMEKAV